MTYAIDKTQFSAKIKSIKGNTIKLRDTVQEALIAATYLCLKNSGGTTPFQQILDAVGGTAHRQGIVTWVETYAPVMMRKDQLLLNKTAWQTLDRDTILADFDAFIVETGMDDIKWFAIAAKKNTTVSIWDGDKAFDSFLKKLESDGQPLYAAALREASDSFVKHAAEIKQLIEAAGETA